MNETIQEMRVASVQSDKGKKKKKPLKVKALEEDLQMVPMEDDQEIGFNPHYRTASNEAALP